MNVNDKSQKVKFVEPAEIFSVTFNKKHFTKQQQKQIVDYIDNIHNKNRKKERAKI